MQAGHDALAPVAADAVPDAHGEHALAPGAAKEPGAQLVQAVAEKAAPEAVPAGHAEQADDPGGAKVPGVHGPGEPAMHADAPMNEYDPDAHAAHDEAEEPAAYVEYGHALHEDEPGAAAKVPALHAGQP